MWQRSSPIRAGPALSRATGARTTNFDTQSIRRHLLPAVLPSRGCNPKNVTIHDTLASAQRTGFRACKRCKPDGPAADVAAAEMVTNACRLIEEIEAAPSLTELANALAISPGYLDRVFKAHTGLTPRAYAAAHRTMRVREALAGERSVTEAIYDAGFNSSGRFYESANAMLGMTPSRFRDGGAQEETLARIGALSP